MLMEQIRIVQAGGDPMGLIRDPGKNHVIELPGWFVRRGDGVMGVRGASARDLSPGEGLLDSRHEVFQVPFGAARPAQAATSVPGRAGD